MGLLQEDSKDPYYGFEAAGCNTGILGLVKTADSGNNAATLLHESMHGLFYSYPKLREATLDYWNGSLSAEERHAFETYLSDLGYDAGNETLVVNEFLAYMTTERSLFGSQKNAPKSNPSKKSGSKKASGSEDLRLLQRVQEEFNSSISSFIPNPKPSLASLKCVFDD